MPAREPLGTERGRPLTAAAIYGQLIAEVMTVAVTHAAKFPTSPMDRIGAGVHAEAAGNTALVTSWLGFHVP